MADRRQSALFALLMAGTVVMAVRGRNEVERPLCCLLGRWSGVDWVMSNDLTDADTRDAKKAKAGNYYFNVIAPPMRPNMSPAASAQVRGPESCTSRRVVCPVRKVHQSSQF